MSKISFVDPSEFRLNIMGVNVEGFSEGTFININREAPTFTQKRSLKGSTQVRKNKNSYYNFTFTLNNGVSANTWLHTIYKMQESYGIAFPIPVLFKDKLGTSTFFCKAAYLQEPSSSYGTDNDTREWTLICNSVSNVIGSNQADDKLSKILSTISASIGIMGALGIDVGGFVDSALTSATNLISGIFR